MPGCAAIVVKRDRAAPYRQIVGATRGAKAAVHMGRTVGENSREIQASAGASLSSRTERTAARVENPLIRGNRPRTAIFVGNAAACDGVGRLAHRRADLEVIRSSARMSKADSRIGAIVSES